MANKFQLIKRHKIKKFKLSDLDKEIRAKGEEEEDEETNSEIMRRKLKLKGVMEEYKLKLFPECDEIKKLMIDSQKENPNEAKNFIEKKQREQKKKEWLKLMLD